MAAIYGVIATSPGIDLDALAPRLDARLAFRAPDGFTHWQRDGALLAHGALHVGDSPARATQPLRLADGRICVADGFVANFDDVRKGLGVDPDLLLDDAQLLAMSVERWGGGFTERVQGEFALALWDPRKRELELVRDHLGARSLCYVRTPDLFAFSSTAMSLLTLPGVETRLDPLGIVTLWYGEATYQKRDYTAFEGIPALAPGHRLTWNAARGAVPTRYWRLQPQPPLRLQDEREYVDAFRETFGSAVARAIRGSRDSALMLSGGIDSAAILAARRGFREGGVADDLLCISAVLAPGDHQPWSLAENRNILTMSGQHSRSLHFKVPVTDEPGSPVTSADLAEAAWSFMHPADISMPVHALACGLAKRNGCRLVLDGTDGDNITSVGMPYMQRLFAEGEWRQAWRESKCASQVNTYLRGQRPAKLFARALLMAIQPDVLHRLRSRRRAERAIRGLEVHPVMAPGLARRTDLSERLRRASALRSDRTEQQRCDHLAHWLGFSMGGNDQIVPRFGLEIRHPWCDLQVVAFFQRLPTAYKARDGWSKWIVRRACEPALGAEVVWHSGKEHLGAFLNRQMLEEAAPYLRLLIQEQRMRLNEYVRDDVVTDTLARLAVPDLVPSDRCDTILTISALAGWLRHVHNQFR